MKRPLQPKPNEEWSDIIEDYLELTKIRRDQSKRFWAMVENLPRRTKTMEQIKKEQWDKDKYRRR